jgi:4-amino-4-deoxychorismate lyase
MKKQQTKILVNGVSSSTIGVTDRGLQFGDGVFETLRVQKGKTVWWQQHMQRLLDGCHRLRFAKLPHIEKLRHEANELLADCNSGTLKIIITRGSSSSGYAASTESIPNISNFQESSISIDWNRYWHGQNASPKAGMRA